MSSIRKKAEGVWVVRYLDGGKPPVGRHRQVTVKGSHAVAKRELERLLGKRASRPRGSAPSRLNFKDLVDRYLKAKQGRLAQAWYEHVSNLLSDVLVPRFGTRLVEDLRAPDIVEYQDEREKEGISGATINRDTDVLMGALNLAEMRGWIERNPIPKTRLIRHKEYGRQRAFTEEEWAAFSSAFDDVSRWEAYHQRVRRFGPPVTDIATGKKVRHGAGRRPDGEASHKRRLGLRAAMDFFRALLLTGTRRGEIQSLTWKQVDLRQGLLTLRLSKTAKKGLRQKVLPLVSGLRVLVVRGHRNLRESDTCRRVGGQHHPRRRRAVGSGVGWKRVA